MPDVTTLRATACPHEQYHCLSRESQQETRLGGVYEVGKWWGLPIL